MSDIEIGSVWVCASPCVDEIEVLETSEDKVVYQVIGGSVFLIERADFLKEFKLKGRERQDDTPKAVKILNEAVEIMAERGKSYDKSGGEAERSMPKIVAMFNALTGHELTPEQGWKFMCCLKLARSEQGEYREDNYLDGAAYMALAGEEAGASSE